MVHNLSAKRAVIDLRSWGCKGLNLYWRNWWIVLVAIGVAMVFRGTANGCRTPRWTLVLLFFTASLQVDWARADQGQCVNKACPDALCCSKAGYCDIGEAYCGLGCQGGPCYVNSPSNSPLDSSGGKCVNNTCADGLCCSQAGYCGPTDKYCGVGCRGGSCYGKSHGKNLGTGAIFGIVIASLVGGVILVTTLFMAWRRTQRNRTREISLQETSKPRSSEDPYNRLI